MPLPTRRPSLRASCALAALLLLTLSAGCGGPPAAAPPAHAHPHHGGAHATPHAHAPPPSPAAPGGIEAQLAEVAHVHGGAGPWAVAGYRMGRHALERLGLTAQSFDLEVIHHSPRAVQYSCIADGAAAATGASLGKLNLSLVEADEASVATTYRRRSTGASITLRPAAAFRARFKDVPREELPAAGRAVMELPDAEVFEVILAPAPAGSAPPAPAAAPRPVPPAP